MVTTIQLQETTKQLLDNLKSKKALKSYDELIKELLGKQMEIKEMFGCTKNRPFKFTREDKIQFHEL